MNDTIDEPVWYQLRADDVAHALDVDPAVGLSSVEAAQRLERHGPNQLDETPPRPAWLRFADQFRDLLVYILAGAAVIALLVGDLKDPIVIAVVLVVNAIMGFVQENRADNALAALEQMLESTVEVRRGGEVLEVPATDVVPGDVVLLEAGDRIPADGRFVLTANTSVDESMLTGESVPVDKQSEPPTADAEIPLAERANVGFMNATLVRGRAEMVVTDTGMGTEIGRLAGLLDAAETRPTPLQEQIHQLGIRLAAIATVAVVAVFLLALAQADRIDGESVGEALLTSVALAVAAIPEGLPAVVTVTLAVGVGRLARRHAVMKRLASVETLGSTTVICSDKTGTLTLNQMTATTVLARGRRYEVDGLGYGVDGAVRLAGEEVTGGDAARLQSVLTFAALCNDAHLRPATGEDDAERGADEAAPGVVGDPTEAALVVLAAKGGIDTEAIRSQQPRVAEVPFDSATKFMATVHAHPDDPQRLWAAVKGAPDVVLARCTSVATDDGPVPLDGDRRARLTEDNEALGAEGLRVLALASAELTGPLAGSPDDVVAELDELCLEALVGIVDPARPEAVTAIAECRAAGISVKMITGDHASTAGAIADRLGIDGEVVTGEQLDAMSDEELARRVEGIGVCARVSPQHKVRIVTALQANGEVVAMTGDGVNDAPALKQAEIGVAMGITGTEVSKEAGDMILADDNFATIVDAVEGGRAIYENIVTFVRFQLTTNISAILTILVGQLVGFGALFNAIQILFVNVIADGPPAIALGVDPPKPDVMTRAPRDRDESILSGRRLSRIVVAAVVIAAGTLGLHAAVREGRPEQAFTMAFSAFVIYQLVNSFCVRSGDETVFTRHSLANRPLLLALGVVVAMQVGIVELGFLQGIFDTVSLTWGEWVVVLVVPLSLLVVEELRKAVARIRQRVGRAEENTIDERT